MMKKFFAALLILALTIGLLAGCKDNSAPTPSPIPTATLEAASLELATPEPTARENLTIGVLIYRYDDTYVSSVRRALEAEAAKQPNVELIINDSKNDQTTQNEQIDELLKQNADALIVNIVDISAAQAVTDKIREAGVPVVFFNREPPEEVIKSYDKARFVGTTPSEAGVIQGNIIAELWNTGFYDTNKDGVMQYLMLKGEADNPEAIARTDFSVMTVNDKDIKTEQLDLQVCNWDSDEAFAAASDWISKFGDRIEFIISNNDDMAQGAIEALQAAGYNDGGENFIPVVGVDATEYAKELISNGYMSGTVLQDAESMAKAVFAMAFNAAQGKDFLAGTTYSYDSSDTAIRIPYLPYANDSDTVPTAATP